MPETLENLMAEGGEALQEARWADAATSFAGALDIAESGEALFGLAEAEWWLGRLGESVAYRERAFKAFGERGDAFQAAYAALALCFDYGKQFGNPVAAGGWLAQASRLVAHHGLEELRGWILLATSFACEDPVRAEELARDAHARGTKDGDRDLELCALSQIGGWLVEQGRIAEGVRCLDESMAVALGAAGRPDTVVFTSCMMMTSCTQCAEFARAAQWVRATTAFSEQYGCPFLYAECRILYGEVLVATGDWEQAETELMTGLEMTRGAVPGLHRLAVAGLAQLWLAQGRVEEADRLVSGLGEHPETAPVLARIHLQMGQNAAATSILRRRLATTGANVLADSLRDVEPEVAVAEARAALVTFEDLGAGADADQAASLLRSLGVKAARLGPRADAGLTKREAEVLGLLGEGLSNPEIAARLHLSRKTVEHHVAHVLAKLGLRGRAEAAAEAVRRLGAGSASK